MELQKVAIVQDKQEVKVTEPSFKVTMIKVARIALYGAISVAVPAMLSAITDSHNPYLVLWGPTIAAAIRGLEGFLRFHVGAPTA